MLKKGTKLYSVVKSKCPSCHEGAFFKHTFNFNPTKITQLHDNCPSCGLKYMIEPSFFYGAMYVNYALTVALSIIVFLISTVVLDLSLGYSFGCIVLALIVLAPLNLRLSRLLWINMFVSYAKENE